MRVCSGTGTDRATVAKPTARHVVCFAAADILRLRALLRVPQGVVEAILDGQRPDRVTLPRLLEPFPAEWQEQQIVVSISLAQHSLVSGHDPGVSS